jgi:hypothetical protein
MLLGGNARRSRFVFEFGYGPVLRTAPTGIRLLRPAGRILRPLWGLRVESGLALLLPAITIWLLSLQEC